MKELSYGVKELQAHLSSALRAVRDGARVVVTSNNRPIAQISATTEPLRKMSSQQRKLEKLIRAGILIRAARPGPIPVFKPLRIGGLLEQLQKDRR